MFTVPEFQSAMAEVCGKAVEKEESRRGQTRRPLQRHPLIKLIPLFSDHGSTVPLAWHKLSEYEGF